MKHERKAANIELKILAIEQSTARSSAALLEDTDVIAGIQWEADRSRNQQLFKRLPELLDAAGQPVLNLNTHWRSRDGYKAWFMNAFALTDLQRTIAAQISEKCGREVRVGRYVDISDSFHIYGSYFSDFEPEFTKMKADPDSSARAWPSDHPAVQMMFDEARRKLAENPDHMRST